MIRVAAALALLVAAAAPAAALAADLREAPVSKGDKVTLGDLFNDAGAAAGLIVARTQPGQMVVLDASKVQFIARSNGIDWGNPMGVRRIVVSGGAAPAPPASAAPAAAAKPRAVQVLAYMHSLNAGDIVHAEDLTWSKEAVADSDAPRDADAVIGMAARRPLREGAAVSLRDVSAPQVIRKDDMVAVVFALGGVNLTLQAKAMEGATAGQVLNVINPVSKKIIQAVATGPGQAIVGPEADQMKLAARSPSSRLALR
jgi:flagella basal body P-ring formation protein FlgA